MWRPTTPHHTTCAQASADRVVWCAVLCRTNVSDTSISVYQAGGAHHLDLRSSNPVRYPHPTVRALLLRCCSLTLASDVWCGVG
jgi:hypothetical protein